MVQQSATFACDPVALQSTINTYEAFRLARAFRQERANSGGAAAGELLWHVPQVLAVHRTLMSSLHPRAGRLRVVDARPSDRDELYVPAAAVRSTIWSFFDVANGRALELVDKHAYGDRCGRNEAEEAAEESILDEDDAVRMEECERVLAEAPADLDARDIDERALHDAVQHAAWFAAHFLEIHPFADGNGRLARILIDALLAPVHPVPVSLISAGVSLDEARMRYINALREVPPWAKHADGSPWAHRPADLSDLILESLAASWSRLSSVQDSLFGTGTGPFLGVLMLSMRSSSSTRRSRYLRLGHCERIPAPSAVELETEADALPPPPDSAVLSAGSPMFVLYSPTGRAEDGWCRIGWVP